MASLKNTTINDTGYLQLPVGTTAQRPGSPMNGDTRFNSQFKVVETYVDGAWKYMPPIVESGLVLHLDAAEPASYPGTGTTWYDLSGNGNHGTFISSPIFESNQGGYIVFDGTDDRIEGNLDYNVSPSEWTAILWSKRSASIITNGTGGQGLELGFNHQTNIIGGNVENISGGDTSTVFNVPSNLISTWNMIAAKYDQTNLAFYINGEFVNQNTIGSRTIATFNQFYINDTQLTVIDTDVFGVSNVHVSGDLAVAFIYDRALSESEIQQNFNALRGRYGV